MKVAEPQRLRALSNLAMCIADQPHLGAYHIERNRASLKESQAALGFFKRLAEQTDLLSQYEAVRNLSRSNTTYHRLYLAYCAAIQRLLRIKAGFGEAPADLWKVAEQIAEDLGRDQPEELEETTASD